MTEPTSEPLPRREAGSPWHWLLIVPVAVPLLVFLYDGKNPYLFGFPRFYWLQLAFIVLGVAATTLVYQLTTRDGARVPASAPPGSARPGSAPPGSAPSATAPDTGPESGTATGQEG